MVSVREKVENEKEGDRGCTGNILRSEAEVILLTQLGQLERIKFRR